MHGLREFHYRAHFAGRSLLPGAHRARVAGAGMDMAASVPLIRARDWRRLDLRTALRDPFGQWWAHEYRQRSSLQAMLLVDVSASMQAGDAQHALVVAFAHALRYSALRRGDAFGMVGFSHELPAALHAPPSRSRQTGIAALAHLAAASFVGRDARALVAAAALMPQQPALVFLLSDFCFDAALLDEALAALARHDVVPLWVGSASAPGNGLLELDDAESGARRTLWMRPSVARRWAAAQAAHRASIEACLARHGRVALPLAAPFDADALSAYFAARG
jgi:von Willebrand factor type A domain